MNSFFRLSLLAIFASGGVALAILLADRTPSAASSSAGDTVSTAAATHGDEAPLANTLVSIAAANFAPRQPLPMGQLPEAAVAPSPSRQDPEPEAEPSLVEPRPALKQQAGGDGIDPEMLRRFEQLGKTLLHQPAQPQPSEAPTAPAPSPAPIAPLPAPSRAPPPPPATPAHRPPREPKSQITRAPGEGDDQLSIHIQDTDIRDVLELLSEQGGLNILASNNVQGKVSAALNNVDIDTALRAILKSTGFVSRRDGKFIYVGSPQDFKTMEQTLDKVGTRIYRPNYIKASEMESLIAPLLTPTVGTVSVSTPSQFGIAADSSQVGGNSFAGGEAVLVRDYEAVLAQVDQVFEELDRRPTQVAIEAMILSVKLKDAYSFGVDFQLLRDKNNIRIGTGSPLSDVGEVSFTDGGLKFGFLDSSLGAFLNALETVGDTNVIATPKLMCLNKQRAEILIGAQLGYISTTQTETSTSQSVEFLEVGTQLRLRPFISDDGLIRMEVHPELSTGSVRVEQGFTLPDKEVTQVTTNIMVRDGCTVIIGGLMREDLITNTSQVPLLGSAPGIGFLFRSKKETMERHELIVLITPHIVCDRELAVEGEEGACEFHRGHAIFSDHTSPIGSRSLGRRYFRMAQKAWAKGDKKSALGLVGVAIHFDPTNRAAIDLRSDINAGSHDGPHSAPTVARPAGPVGGLDGPAVAPWVLDKLEAEGPSGPPRYSHDPGETGRVRDIRKPEKLQ